jgi:hypothetical protein
MGTCSSKDSSLLPVTKRDLNVNTIEEHHVPTGLSTPPVLSDTEEDQRYEEKVNSASQHSSTTSDTPVDTTESLKIEDAADHSTPPRRDSTTSSLDEKATDQEHTLVVAEEEQSEEILKVQKEEQEEEEEEEDVPFQPYTLQDIRRKIKDLANQVPKASKAEMIDASCPTQVSEYVESIDRLADQYHLLLFCVKHATYKWDGKCSGAEEQNRGYLTTGLNSVQHMIVNAAQRDMTDDMIAPSKSKLLSKTVDATDEETGALSSNYVYTDNKEDEHLDQYIAKRMSRNAPLQRHILLSAFDLACRYIDDYLEASNQDAQVEHASMMMY